MKLLFILSEYLPDSGGGIISFYGQVLPELVHCGHEVSVLVANHHQLDRPAAEVDGVRVEYLQASRLEAARAGLQRFQPTPTLWAFLPLAWAAFHQCDGGAGFDVVESTDWMLLLAPWVVAKGKAPVVVSLHGSCGQVDWYGQPDRSFADSDFVRLIETALIRQAMTVHANSRNNAEFWIRQTARPVAVIPPAFPGPAKAALNPPPVREVGLVVGRLQSWKGPHVLCEALRLVPAARVEWIGRDTVWNSTGELTSSFLARQYSDVFGSRLIHRSPAPHAEVLRQMQGAKFVCVPSTWDVFNLTAAEALASGTPLICSSGAGAEMLVAHGVNGFRFESGNADALAACLRAVLAQSTGERDQMVERAGKTIQAQLAPDHIATLLTTRYQEIRRRGISTQGDEWLEHLLTPAAANPAPKRSGFITKARRILARVAKGK
ncbi:MAG: glycosyltransferase family 4 protein [Verrucomicrobiota bacterium]